MLLIFLMMAITGCSDIEPTSKEEYYLTNMNTEQTGNDKDTVEAVYGREADRLFQLGCSLQTNDLGAIHYNISVPDGYKASHEYALHIALPGWEGLYFQGIGEDLRWEYLPYESPAYVEDMIVVSLQLDDARNEVEKLEEESAQEGFWNDTENSQKVQKRISSLKNKIEKFVCFIFSLTFLFNVCVADDKNQAVGVEKTSSIEDFVKENLAKQAICGICFRENFVVEL